MYVLCKVTRASRSGVRQAVDYISSAASFEEGLLAALEDLDGDISAALGAKGKRGGSTAAAGARLKAIQHAAAVGNSAGRDAGVQACTVSVDVGTYNERPFLERDEGVQTEGGDCTVSSRTLRSVVALLRDVKNGRRELQQRVQHLTSGVTEMLNLTAQGALPPDVCARTCCVTDALSAQ